jgi:hypothetical protein
VSEWFDPSGEVEDGAVGEWSFSGRSVTCGPGVENLVFAGKKSEGQACLRCAAVICSPFSRSTYRNRYYRLILVFYTLQVVLSIGTDIRM